MFRQNVAGQQRKQLIAPQNAFQAINHADAVAIAIETNAKVQFAVRHRCLQLHQIFSHRRVGVMGRKGAVHHIVQRDMAARQPGDQVRQNIARRAIAAVPADGEGNIRGVGRRQFIQIGRPHVVIFDAARAVLPITRAGHAAQFLKLAAKEWLVPQHQFEAVVIRRIVGSRDHDARVGRQMKDREIQHRCRSAADPQSMDARVVQAAGQILRHFDRCQPAIVTHRNPVPAVPGDDGPERPAHRIGVRRRQGFADDAAHVVFTQHGGVKFVVLHLSAHECVRTGPPDGRSKCR